MREMLFKAKRVDGKGWAEGSLLLPTTDNQKTMIVAWNGARFEVHPETVCQFTGLLDIHGEKVFEGEILEVDGGDEACNTTIYWDKDLAQFSDKRDFDGDSFRTHDGDMDWVYFTKIVGNIHDSPELL
jgi:hypothetical protein